MSQLTRTLKSIIRDFTGKRGRIGRSRFFIDLCIVFAAVLIYIGAVELIEHNLEQWGLSYDAGLYFRYGNTLLFFLLLAFGTVNVRRKRLRDIRWPLYWDWPVFFTLCLHGLGPLFSTFNIPYLSQWDVFSMPPEVRDNVGIILLIWLLVMLLAPSKSRFSKRDILHKIQLEKTIRQEQAAD